MYKLKPSLLRVKCPLKVLVIAVFLISIYLLVFPSKQEENAIYKLVRRPANDYNVWLIFTKVSEGAALTYKFHNLLENILNVSTVPIKFHIVVDNTSKEIAKNEISDVVSHSNKPILYIFYDIEYCTKNIRDITEVMMQYFAKPGAYYSDALFYISLGLHRIAPVSQKRAILLDCDLYFKKDIKLLFDQFKTFKTSALFGLAPELNPVYRHVLRDYKLKHNTTFGEFYHSNALNATSQHPKGFQGYNSGVVLINLAAIRRSKEYANLLSNEMLFYLTRKYSFVGHLGDQDFYTLVGFEYPHLIQTINCGYNRQLCVWWRDNGYRDVFQRYFKCKHDVVVLHGNCKTKIPKN